MRYTDDMGTFLVIQGGYDPGISSWFFQLSRNPFYPSESIEILRYRVIL